MQKRFGKKEALLQAAMEEFSLQYYDQASLNTILQHSGVGKGNFYYHFKNKEQLYEAVAVLLAQKKLQFFSARPEAAEAESLPLFAKFRLLGELSELFTCSDPVIEGLIFHITTEPSAAARRISERALGSGSRSYFLDLVEDARREDQIRSDIPADFEAELLGFFFSSFARAFGTVDAEGHLDTETILQKFSWYMDVIERGMKA